MSHFSMLVVTKEVPTQKIISDILQPWHEFECTGLDNKYVQDIDITEEARNGYLSDTTTRYIDIDNNQHDPYQDKFYREFTSEELEKIRPAGSGCGDGISWSSKDWKDGKGYRPKAHYLPDGWREEQIPSSQLQSFSDYVEGYYGIESISSMGDLDIEDKHKYGYMLIDPNSETKVIDRTNPNKKWDWWQIGGRYSGKIYTISGDTPLRGKRSWTNEKEIISGFDSAQRKDIDLNKMLKIRITKEKSYTQEAISQAQKYIPDFDVIAFERYIYLVKKLRDEWKALGEKKPAFWQFLDSYNGDESEFFQNARKKGGHYINDFELGNSCETFEQYYASLKPISAYGIIKDGEWIGNGDMGWFGMSSNETDNWDEKFWQIFETIKPEEYLTIIDCHI